MSHEFVLASPAVSRMACLSYWIVLEIGGKWPYNCCFVGCCFQDSFNIAHCILVQFLSRFSSINFASVHVVHPYSRINITAAWKKSRFILSYRSDFSMIDNLSITVHAFAWCILMSLSVDEIQLLRCVNLLIWENYRLEWRCLLLN